MRRTRSITIPTAIASATAVSGRVMPQYAMASAAMARSCVRPDVRQRAMPHQVASQARLVGTSERYIAWKYNTGNEVTHSVHVSIATMTPAKRRASTNTSMPLSALATTMGRPGKPKRIPGAMSSDVPGGYFDEIAGTRLT